MGPLEWHQFVARTGEPGALWVESFRAEPIPRLWEEIAQALALLRRRRIAEGAELLDRIGAAVDGLGGERGSPAFVLRRWHATAIAYLHYVRDDLTAAERSLDEAHAIVVAAIEQHRFLMPLAGHCAEFLLQHIRIARQRRRWDQMERTIQQVRRILSDDAPLCRLADGSEVSFATIEEYYRSQAPISPAEVESLAPILDSALRLRQFERFVQWLYVPPGFVIPYP